jgi:hypothetical protein
MPTDPAFADAALARLRSLPSRIAIEDWGEIGAHVGATATKPLESISPTPAAPTPAAATTAARGSSINDLLASLSSMKVEIKKIETAKPAAAAPLFCPKYDWRKALELVQDGEDVKPGAHRRKLAVAFAAARTTAQMTYAPITAQAIDANHAALDNQPVELQVTEIRESSTNPSVFPAGMAKNDYDAYSIAMVGESTRTRMALVVRGDTNAAKFIGRAVPTQILRVRGIARVPANPGALSIVVDSAETVEG